MELYTIGFAKKKLEHFIGLLCGAGVEKVIDTRLHNTSQLAGFAKKDDLRYILSLVDIDYEHCKDMAPSNEILKGFKRGEMSWAQYEKEYLDLLNHRSIEYYLKTEVFHPKSNCLLCSEHDESFCHRRLLANYLKSYQNDLSIQHLK